MELAFGSLEEVHTLLALGESVEVLSPPEAREEMTRAAATIVGLYATGSARDADDSAP